MKNTKIRIDTNFQIGKVDSRIFGGFIEHMGRAIYEGVYDPKSDFADEDGFRTDVMGALNSLNIPIVRYPGGNFASGYNWMDGVGPKDERPVIREFAWQSIEPNTFGTDEFIKLCSKMGWLPMLTVNLGTGTPEMARNWVEYTNIPEGTKFSDLRKMNGNEEPFGINLWCLGNEMDGPWQIGHVPAREYAIRAQQAAKMMKDVDNSIETVLCGSSGTDLPTYPDWDLEVLEHVGDLADYISLHKYVGNHNRNTSDFLAVTNAIDEQIQTIDSACRFMQAKMRTKKRVYLCFDEWNVWYKEGNLDGKGKFAPHLIEERYTMEDALVVAGFLNSFIRNADVVKIANIAQLVNVIAPIITVENDILVQSIYYPFKIISSNGKGISLNLKIDGPGYESKSYGYVDYIDASAILNQNHLNIFLIGRNVEEQIKITIEIGDRSVAKIINCDIVHHNDPKMENTFSDPNAINIKHHQKTELMTNGVSLAVPPLSFIHLGLELA
jgi:alpha-N-arabinofuranosidase